MQTQEITETNSDIKETQVEQLNASWSNQEEMLFNASDFDTLSTKRAQSITGFDDAIDVGSRSEISMDIRKIRGAAPIMVPMAEFMVVEGMNARLPTPEWQEHIHWLAEQMLIEGFRQDKPIYGFVSTEPKTGAKKIGIIDGESRYEAAKIAISKGAQITALPTVMAPDGLSIEEMTIELATSNTGKPFTPMEMAMLTQRFVKWGRNHKQICKILKVSPSYVSQLIAIAKAPNRVRTMITERQISVQVAMNALKDGAGSAITQLEAAVSNAQSKGLERVTAKHLPEYRVKRAARTYAPQMQSVLQKLKLNEGVFAMFDDDVREEIETLLSDIEQMSKHDPVAEAQAKAEAKAKRLAERQAAKEAKAAKAAKAAKSTKPRKPRKTKQLPLIESPQASTTDAAVDPQSPTVALDSKATPKQLDSNADSESEQKSSVQVASEDDTDAPFEESVVVRDIEDVFPA